MGRVLSVNEFQLTASQGGWQRNWSKKGKRRKFQLTASQGGWHSSVCKYSCFTVISTHSLTRRLTWTDIFCSKRNYISTHSLTRRLTYTMKTNIPQYEIFQLTASQGGWLKLHRTCKSENYFNSQPHKEADLYTPYLLFNLRYFNSQPHKEADNMEEKQYRYQNISTHSLTRRLTWCEKVRC